MTGIGLLRTSADNIPRQRRVYVIAWVFYAVILVALVAFVRPHRVQLNPAGATTQVGIAAFNPGAVGTAGTSPPKAAPTQPAKRAVAARATRATAVSNDQMNTVDGSGAPAAAQGSGSGSGPVNLGTGAGLTLLNKVIPTYPPVMQQARMPGTVVLEAIIHRDGSIGDVSVKSATNDSFAQAAIQAVKRWRYSPIPYEGIVSVTVNFNLPG